MLADTGDQGRSRQVYQAWLGLPLSRILAASGRPTEAIRSFDRFIANGPVDLDVAAAEYYSALAVGAAGDQASEQLALQEMGYGHPNSVLAPEALARVGRLYEAAGDV